jgi:hypothetical protein
MVAVVCTSCVREKKFLKGAITFRMPKQNANYAAAIAGALRAELGDSHRAVKSVMRWTGASERTVKNWLAGRRGPRGDYLVDLIRHSDKTLDFVLRLAGREQIMMAKTLIDARNALAGVLQQIDSCVDNGRRPR